MTSQTYGEGVNDFITIALNSKTIGRGVLKNLNLNVIYG